MRNLFVRSIFVLVSGLIAITAGGLSQAAARESAAGGLQPNLIQNGMFTGVTKTGQLEAWTPLAGSTQPTTGSEDGYTFATITSTDAGSTSGITQDVPLNAEWGKMLVRGYVKVDELTLGTAANADEPAGVLVALKWSGAKGRTMPIIAPEVWSDATVGGVEINQLLTVPDGAEHLSVTLEVNHSVGTADFRDISLVGFVQTFDDEFDGTSVDNSRWTISEGVHNVTTPEAQWFDPGHVIVANGIVRIHGEQKAHGDLQYQSGEITSIGKFQQLYGLFEFRLRVPETPGIWPAAYLLKWDDGWPPEIDVEELSGRDTRGVLETNHFADDYGRHGQSQVNWDGSLVDRTQWHTYAVVWEPGRLAWYFDDIYKGTTNAPLTSDVPMYMRINMAIGSFGGDPRLGTWPQDFDCDYVHVYQRYDLPLPVYPTRSEEISLPAGVAQLSAIACNPMAGASATWTIVDAPGKAVIADPHSVNTTAICRVPGMYRFKLTVDKGASAGSEYLLVYVDPATGGGR